MLKALLVDDNPFDREILESFLKKYCFVDIAIAGQAGTTDEAYKLILECRPDIVFLDVELGTESGFELLQRFPEFFFKVIFVTAYEKYAIRAIKFNALDFILKPVDIADLVLAVAKVKSAAKISMEEELRNILHNLAHPHEKANRIAVPVLTGYKMIPVEDIMYCEASKEYTYIYCLNGESICSSVNLGEYEDLLTEYSFFRVHHSYLVNRDHVKQYIKGEGGELIINKETVIPVSRRKKAEMLEWLTAE